jgi:hypothetical protein
MVLVLHKASLMFVSYYYTFHHKCLLEMFERSIKKLGYRVTGAIRRHPLVCEKQESIK